MTDHPSFLPPMLELEGTWEDVLALLYSVFEKDFKKSKTFHQGKRVLYDGRILPDGKGKEEGFWHVITKIDYKSKERVPDYDRARRLPWAKPLMESKARAEIMVFDHDEGTKDKGVRRYIWLKEYDYLMILRPSKYGYYWLTAFYVDFDGMRKSLERKYNDWLRKSNGRP